MSKAMVEALVARVDTQDKRIDALEKDLASKFAPNVQGKTLSQPPPPAKEKKEKKEKKPKTGGDDKPKVKRITGYILFGKAERDNVLLQLTVSDDKPKNTEVLTEVARQWRVLPQTERDEWNAKAKKMKDLVPDDNDLHAASDDSADDD